LGIGENKQESMMGKKWEENVYSSSILSAGKREKEKKQN
jgi:hypothetical protein